MISGERNKGWQFGENLRTQCSGWFPLAYTEPVLDDSVFSYVRRTRFPLVLRGTQRRRKAGQKGQPPLLSFKSTAPSEGFKVFQVPKKNQFFFNFRRINRPQKKKNCYFQDRFALNWNMFWRAYVKVEFYEKICKQLKCFWKFLLFILNRKMTKIVIHIFCIAWKFQVFRTVVWSVIAKTKTKFFFVKNFAVFRDFFRTFLFITRKQRESGI